MSNFRIYNTCRLFSLFFLLIIFNCSQTEAKAVPFTKVILDAGHGGHDLGGTFGLTFEKHLALDVVRRVDVFLRSQGISTKLTRSNDSFISLPRRARIANAESGAIFVSIHFNQTEQFVIFLVAINWGVVLLFKRCSSSKVFVLNNNLGD